ASKSSDTPIAAHVGRSAIASFIGDSPFFDRCGRPCRGTARRRPSTAFALRPAKGSVARKIVGTRRVPERRMRAIRAVAAAEAMLPSPCIDPGMQLIDIGANLTHDSFAHDRDTVLARARDAGVSRMIVTGASREHSPQALALAQAHPGVLFATAGVHPHHATEYTAECDAELRALQAHPEVVAVGETGLDYFRDFSPRPAQRRAFERQLQIGVDTGKPLFLHQRDAHADFVAIMKDFEG